MDDLFGGAKPEDVTLERQVQCVQRELDLRRRCYPQWVATDRIGEAEANTELVCMDAVLHTLVDHGQLLERVKRAEANLLQALAMMDPARALYTDAATDFVRAARDALTGKLE